MAECADWHRSSGWAQTALDVIPTGWYGFDMNQARTSAREKLLNAAVAVIRTKGYGATTVDDLCKTAGVTKGAFFHHFKTKEELGVAATRHWNTFTGALFADAPYHLPADPVERILAYIDFRAAIVEGRSVPEFTCLLGTIVQETYSTNDALRAACDSGISSHATTLENYVSEAMEQRGVGGFTPESLVLYTQATLQGAFILAKAKGNANVTRDMIAHLRRYIELLFNTAHKGH
jgi:TetR/AcrR family transcriptional regulator, transcriptional repressor for nem operon